MLSFLNQSHPASTLFIKGARCSISFIFLEIGENDDEVKKIL
jgi:hypothetical protein